MSRASSSASMRLPEFSTAFAAWQALGRTPIADPSGYQIANLDSITAVVIGGTSLFGGRGGVAGTFIGTLIVVALKNGLTQAGIDSLYQQIATGALVMLAVGVDQYSGAGATRMTLASTVPTFAMHANGLTKHYGQVVAMEDADFELARGRDSRRCRRQWRRQINAD